MNVSRNVWKSLGYLIPVLLLAFALGFSLPAPAGAGGGGEPCGELGNCNWASGGCSENWSCVRKACNESACPEPDGSLDECHYCKPPA